MDDKTDKDTLADLLLQADRQIETGDFEKAIESYHKALQLDPANTDILQCSWTRHAAYRSQRNG